MSDDCPRNNVLSKKQPWVLLYWDTVGGWSIAARSRTRRGAKARWKHLDDGYAIVKIHDVVMPPASKCDCRWHKKRRKHFHPCPECPRMVACGKASCRNDLGPKWICRLCLWKRDFKKPPTEDEIKRYQILESDAEAK